MKALVVVDSHGVQVGVLGVYEDDRALDARLLSEGWRPAVISTIVGVPHRPYWTKPGHVRLLVVPFEVQP